MLILNDSNFDQVISDGITFVDFFTTWCPPCRMFMPVFEQMSKDNPNIKFVKVNTGEADSQEIGERYQISVVPTIVVFKYGERIHTWKGAPSVQEMNMIIQAAEAS